MACALGPQVFCDAISHLRVAEDAISAVLLGISIALLVYTAQHISKKGPLVPRLYALAGGLFPFFLWKIIGTYRRCFLIESGLSIPLYGFGEFLEAVSGVCILLALAYMATAFQAEK